MYYHQVNFCTAIPSDLKPHFLCHIQNCTLRNRVQQHLSAPCGRAGIQYEPLFDYEQNDALG